MVTFSKLVLVFVPDNSKEALSLLLPLNRFFKADDFFYYIKLSIKCFNNPFYIPYFLLFKSVGVDTHREIDSSNVLHYIY